VIIIARAEKATTCTDRCRRKTNKKALLLLRQKDEEAAQAAENNGAWRFLEKIRGREWLEKMNPWLSLKTFAHTVFE
jgi:hypothetical protein